jgi:membrane protein DedA with SNARE-associated domain
MQEFIFEIMNRFGYLGVGFLIAIENIFPPIPSEVILIFGGFMTTVTDLNVWLVIVAATIGAVFGAIILYAFGRLITPVHLEKFISGRIGQFLCLESSDIQRAESLFAQKGILTVFFCRFVPLIRSLVSIPAGSARMDLGKFLFLTTLGTAIWNTILVWLGVFAGKSWASIVRKVDNYSTVIFSLVSLALVIFAFIYLNRRKKRKSSEDI